MPDNVDLSPGYNFLTLSLELSFCSWISAESTCSLGAAKVSLTEPEERIELATGCGCLWKLCPFPCSWVTHQETLSFLMHLLSIIMVATVIHPYRRALLCLNTPRRSCVTGQAVGDDLPISTVATGERACFSSSSGTAQESSVSLLTC